MHDGEQKIDGPRRMHITDGFQFRVLHRPRKAGQQPRHAQPGYDADKNADVKERINLRHDAEPYRPK